MRPDLSLCSEVDQRLADLTAKKEQELRQLEAKQGEIIRLYSSEFEQRKAEAKAAEEAARNARAKVKAGCVQLKCAVNTLKEAEK